MESRKNAIGDNVGSNNESCDKESASTRVVWRVLAYENVRKILKELLKKE